MKETLIFYKDWWEAIKGLPADMQLEAYHSICAYAFEGVVPTNPMIAAVTALMRSAIDRDNAKWDKVREKRRAAVKSRWDRHKAEQTNTNDTSDTNVYTSIQMLQTNTNDTTNTVNVNDNVNVNVNVNDNVNVNGSLLSNDNNDNNNNYIVVVEPRIFKGDFLKDFFSPNRQASLDAICMNNRIDMDTLRRLAKEVTDEWEVIEVKPHSDKSSAFQHLVNQIRIKLQSERRNGTTSTDMQRHDADARQQEFRQYIATRLSTPDPPEPDINNYY